jgi:glucose/arabinose dehydrogenase
MLSICGGRVASVLALIACGAIVGGCYMMRPSSGAGQTPVPSARNPDPAAVVVPPGYVVELVARGLTFPTGVAVDDAGRVHVVESGYSYGEVFTEPRLLRIESSGQPTTVASGARGGPWTGVAWHRGQFFIADGNVLEGGRILRVSPEGRMDALVSDLPSFGDHHTNGPIAGPDGWIYFGQGTATNAGIVGRDNFDFGWLKRKPEFHDVPGQDVTLSGENAETEDVFAAGAARKTTGPFRPFGTPAQRGQVIKGAVKASGAILRIRPEGGEPEQVAWGFRNPFGLSFAPDGALYVTDNGYDERGSRRVWGSPDMLWRVERGKWHGWPDYVAGIPITDAQFHGPGNPPLRFVLANHPNPVPRPVAKFAVHSSADGLDFSRSAGFGYTGEAFVAIFGDQSPATGKILGPVGGKVVRVNVQSGVITDFAVNRADRDGPASKVGGNGFERPVAVRFTPNGDMLYVVDFGVLRMEGKDSRPQQNTGSLWRIRRQP